MSQSTLRIAVILSILLTITSVMINEHEKNQKFNNKLGVK